MTIVTAYYKLDLSHSSPQSYKSKRSIQTYLDFFRYWAGLKNTFVIYTNDLELEKEIIKMREAHHLQDQTIIIQKDLESFAPSALESIKQVFASYNQNQDRFDPSHPPHTSPEYDYLMYCKSFFVCDAIARGLTDEEALWLDFGYGLGNLTYSDPSQFNFTLSPCEKIKKDKINFFSLGDLDERTLPHILIYGTDHFLTGGCIYGNKTMWKKFNTYMQEALQAFISFNIIDDDQKLYIWCLRNYPDDFHLVWEDRWFHGLFYFIPSSLRNLIKTTKPTILRYLLIQENDAIPTLSHPSPQNKPQNDPPPPTT